MPGFNIPMDNSCDELGEFGVRSRFAGPDHYKETARKHRYRLELMQANGRPMFGTDASGILLYCYKCTRPSPEIDEVVIHSGQDEIYRPGKNRWKPIEFTFYEIFRGDPGRNTYTRTFVDNCAELIYDWWAKTMISLTTSSQSVPQEYLAQGRLQVLDGVGTATWEYNLLDCWPVRVSPSDMSFTDTEIADISVTLRYQKAYEREPVLK
jgi:hypothetical protein